LVFLLDTNVAIRLRDAEPEIVARVAALEGAVLLSIVSRVELEDGVYREPAEVSRRRSRLDVILAALPVVDFDASAADVYRTIVATAGYSRRKLLDRMIAAQAIVHQATLITQNAADFRDCPGLSILEW
jgi:tRNA(fMet)-specific endonuclease VapC